MPGSPFNSGTTKPVPTPTPPPGAPDYFSALANYYNNPSQQSSLANQANAALGSYAQQPNSLLPSQGSTFNDTVKMGSHGALPLTSNQYTPNPNSSSPFYDSTKQAYGFGPGQDQGPLVQQGQPLSPGDQFYQDLMNQLSSITGGGASLGDLTNQANTQAGLQYDPLIKQLQQNLASSKTNEAAASGKVGSLYDSLGKALAAQIPVITNQFANAKNQSQQQYQTLQNQIQNNYQGAQQAQAAELQKLGIQAALPQSTEKLNRDQQYLSGQAATNGQALNDTLGLMGQGESDFAQRASLIAPQQGANTQADMARQLLQLETQINQQVAGYQGQKGATAAQILSQLQGQQASNFGKQQTDAIDNAYKLAQLRQLTSPDIFGHATSNNPPSYQGLSGVNKYFTDNSSINDPTALTKAFLDFQNSPELQKLTGPGGIGSPTLETAWPLLKQIAQKENPNITSGALNELMNALAIKFGKY